MVKSNWVVLGKHPGEGGEYKADGPKDAIIAFFADQDGIPMKEVRQEIDKLPVKIKRIDADHYQFGDYEINRMGFKNKAAYKHEMDDDLRRANSYNRSPDGREERYMR